jgi:transposase
MFDPETLPANAEQLKGIIRFQVQNHAIEIQKKDAELQERDRYIDILQEALRLARMAHYASTSEKLPSNQCELFNEAEVGAEVVALEEQPGIEVPAHTRNRPIRKPFPDDLPREEVIIDLLESEKVCEQDGSPLKEIGSEVSEQLDVIPTQMKVIRTIRKKYACPCCEETVKTAKLPEKILPKSNATPGLLAHIAVSKYVDALPLYRLEQIFKRSDIDIPRNTMAGWMIALTEKLQPIYNLMEEDLLSSDYVCCDETVVQVLKEPGKKAQSKSYMWVRSRHGPEISPIVLFDYDPTRSGTVPNRLLKDFKGYLQVDGYVGYDEVCRDKGIIRVGCMAHVRRKFYEVQKASPKQSSVANRVLLLIQKLYKIDEQIREEKIPNRFKIRQEQSGPILQEIKAWLDENKSKYPPQGLMGKAITYAQNQWPYVTNYLKYGKLAIDNNFTENRIRPFAIGRKNWLFSDTQAGANASGMIYSILQTARGNGLDPYAYMRYLLTELPKCQTADQIEKLTPHKIDSKILR